jgi:hypothetical protein
VNKILDDVHGYISGTLHAEMDSTSMPVIDYEHIASEPFVVQIMETAFAALKNYYGE